MTSYQVERQAGIVTRGFPRRTTLPVTRGHEDTSVVFHVEHCDRCGRWLR